MLEGVVKWLARHNPLIPVLAIATAKPTVTSAAVTLVMIDQVLRWASVVVVPALITFLPDFMLKYAVPKAAGFLIQFMDVVYSALPEGVRSGVVTSMGLLGKGAGFIDIFVDVGLVWNVLINGFVLYIGSVIVGWIIGWAIKVIMNWVTLAAPAAAGALV